jgi:tetratricopeptide (TPR) repeat protein
MFLFKDGKHKGLKRKLVCLAAIAGLGVCIYAPLRPTAYGMLDHTALYKNYLSAFVNGKKDKAEKSLGEISEKYGEDDDTRFMRVCTLVSSGDLAQAEEVANGFKNKANPDYLLSWEAILQQKYASAEEIYENLMPYYLKAADEHPDWAYPARQAGGLLYDRGEYDKAAYYLTRAMLYSEEDDAEVYYYLGATLCEQDNYEKGLPLLNRAYELGVDDHLLGCIKYYVEQSGIGDPEKEGQENA